jgi:hypothetical protein
MGERTLVKNSTKRQSTNQRSLKLIVWLLVIFTGIAFGAGVYEARVEIPQWLGTVDGVITWKATVAKAADPGLHFWAFVTTGPITLLTLLSALFVWRSQGYVRRWWLVVLTFLLIDRTMTFGYFIPTMVELMSGKMSPADAVATAQQWSNLNIVRLVASGASFLAAIKLLTEFYKQAVPSTQVREK